MFILKMNFVIFFFGIFLFNLTFISGKLPEYIKTCSSEDPKVNQCIRNSIEELRPKLQEGIPELNVPAVEPMLIPRISMSRGPKNANIAAEITNLQVWGPSNFIITDLSSDIKNNRFDFKILLPKLHFEGQYEMDMRILLVNLHGQGDIYGNFTNYKCNVTMKGHKIKKDDQEYLEFDRLRLKLSVGHAQLNLTNLFNGDPLLGAASNRLINDHSKAFIEEIAPVLERAIADLFTDIANRITLQFTYNELFP